MLPIYLDISDEAKRIINKNIWCMFDLLEATCAGLSYAEILDGIFPPYILDENLDKCVKVVGELYNMSIDKYEREYLSPFHEWTLYHTILWWFDVTDHIDLYKTLNDIENYFDFLFQDWDFLYVDKIYTIYKKSPVMLEQFFHIEIEQYIELMPRDLQEEYKKLNELKTEKNESSKEKEQYIVNNIYSFLQLEMLKAKKYENCNEVDLGDDIRNGVFLLFKEHGIDIEREARAGIKRALRKKTNKKEQCHGRSKGTGS